MQCSTYVLQMSESLHISKFCIIRNNTVVVDHNKIYEEIEIDAPEFFKRTYKHFKIGYPKFYKMDNLSKLGFLTAELLLKGRNLNREYGKDKTGIVLANAAASLDTDRTYQLSIAERNHYFPSPSVFVYTLPNIVMGEISIRHQLFGENNFFVQEKLDTDFMHAYVGHLFQNNIVACCITGWVEMDADRYDAMLLLVEKKNQHNQGIAIFNVQNISDIYFLEI